VTIVPAIDSGLPPVIGDRTQLLQVLVNLVTNANDAMPSGGTLTVRAEAEGAAEGSRVVITVRDTGSGMDDETAARIFEPFYTTKEQGKGTGLGLSTSAAIVRSHGGILDVDTRPGSGSEFTLSLPASSHAELQAPQQPEPVPLLQGDGELVLVVDDEDEVRQIVRSSLEDAGYRTLEARSGEQALDVLAEHGQAVRLVVMDVMMPGLGGRATSARMAERHPELPVLLASGFDADNVVPDRSDVARFLPKPFTVSELLLGVRSALDAAEARR
jgi:two-component system cell cycle sensor histidine kinase/response regulator CckA